MPPIQRRRASELERDPTVEDLLGENQQRQIVLRVLEGLVQYCELDIQDLLEGEEEIQDY